MQDKMALNTITGVIQTYSLILEEEKTSLLYVKILLKVI